MENFFVKWLVTTVIILAIPSIALEISMLREGAGYTGSAVFFLFLMGIPISMAIMGIVWLKRRLADDEKMKAPEAIVSLAMLLPLGLLILLILIPVFYQ